MMPNAVWVALAGRVFAGVFAVNSILTAILVTSISSEPEIDAKAEMFLFVVGVVALSAAWSLAYLAFNGPGG